MGRVANGKYSCKECSRVGCGDTNWAWSVINLLQRERDGPGILNFGTGTFWGLSVSFHLVYKVQILVPFYL